jgi:uncharacterized protein involved in exopolysaccharide biosynthesis
MEEQEQMLDVRRYLQIIFRRRHLFIAVAAGIMTLITAFSYVMPTFFEASTTVSIEKNYLNLLMRDIAVAPSMGDRVQALSVVMTSRRTLLRMLDELGVPLEKMSDEEISKLVKHYQKNTKIKIDVGRSSQGDADLFTVIYRDRDPRFARDYVNALVRNYVIDSLAAKREEALGANKFVYEQLELYKRKISGAESALDAERKRLGVVLVSRLEELQKKYDDMLIQYTDQHPDVLRIKDEIASIKSQLRQSVAAEIETERLRKKDRMAAGRGSKSLNDLERERDAYVKVYESLVATLGRSEVSAQVEVKTKADTFNILEPAILPVEPVNRPRWKIILLGIMVGIAGAAGTVILYDMTDRTIKNVETLKTMGMPVIGIIPRIASVEAILAAKRKDRLAYGFAGMYLITIGAIAFVEFLR